MHKLKRLYRRSLFNDSIIGFFLNSSYISRRSLYKVLKSKSWLFEGKEVLDIGCGSKPYRDLFSKSLKYIGLDTNQSGHDHSEEQIDVFYDGLILPFDNETFDYIVSFQTLEHVADELNFLKEIRRVLKPGGRVILTFPFCWPEHEQPYDFRRFTSFGGELILKNAGFKNIFIQKTCNFPQMLFQLLNSYFSISLKTSIPILNIFINLLHVPLFNSLGFVFGALSKNQDLFCDLIVEGER